MSFKESLENLRTLDLQSLLRDFRGLDPNDPGQWPLAPRVATLLAIFFVPLFFVLLKRLFSGKHANRRS